MLVRSIDEILEDREYNKELYQGKIILLARKYDGGGGYYLKLNFVYDEKIYDRNDYKVFIPSKEDVFKLRIVDGKAHYKNEFKNFVEMPTYSICTVEEIETSEAYRLRDEGKAIIY